MMPATRDGWTPFVGLIYGVREMRSSAANPNFGEFGPDHPAFGRQLPEETKKRLSEQKRGAVDPDFGKVMSAEEKKRRSDALEGRPMPSSVRSAHTRYHTNKGVFEDTCTHCLDDQRSQADEGNSND